MKGIGDYPEFFIISIPRGFPCFLVHPYATSFDPLFIFFFLVAQSVKEVLQSLVDDNLVQTDKIGSSNCKVIFSLLSPRTPAFFLSQKLTVVLVMIHYAHVFSLCSRAHASLACSLLELPFPEGCDRESYLVAVLNLYLESFFRGDSLSDVPQNDDEKKKDAKPP
jgi:hypothetical protein